MSALAISMEKDTTQTKFGNKKSNSLNLCDIAGSNFTMTSYRKLILIYSTLCFPEPLV